ncbi:hypothetical protein [Enorma phocaeensis]|uniref:hypothetical protein n=1 Tax=Enorma phocaeensis TaxID=1871019 RepID=UPI002356B54C|nr:hypothetical protein [Enorma phocaeensis]
MVVRKWEHAGMTCAIRHGVLGCPCGYVRVPEGHPFHGRRYDECDVEAYGGLTFSGEIGGEGGWWLGFDMAHIFDFDPGLRPYGMVPLRTDDDCARETERLAERLAERGQ